MKKEVTFREFNLDLELLPWEMVLVDVPEPDPGKLNFRQAVKERPMTRVKESGLVSKLIEHLKVNK
jgi:hypothetical protein